MRAPKQEWMGRLVHGTGEDGGHFKVGVRVMALGLSTSSPHTFLASLQSSFSEIFPVWASWALLTSLITEETLSHPGLRVRKKRQL